MPTFPGPEQPQAPAVPGDHGGRLNQNQGRLPVTPQPAEPDPEVAIRGGQLGLLDRAPEDTELVTEGEDLQLKGRTAMEEGQQGCEHNGEPAHRRESTDSDQLPIYQQ